MIPLAVPNLSGKEKEYLNRCIDTTFVSSVGQFVNDLEEKCAQQTGAAHAVAVSCGTTALQLALLAYGIGPGDLVVIPSFTFIATANAIMHCGAEPWLLDIDTESWTLSTDQLEKELAAHTIEENGVLIHKESRKKVKAIMPVYTLGNAADMDGINAIASQYKLPVIADGAAAIGMTYKGRNLGDLADLTALSFNGNKTITAGGGGAVIGNDKEKIDFIRHISTTARVTAEYDFDMVGFNYRMTNLQAAVGCAQLERAKELVSKKQYIRQFYEKAFEGEEVVSTFREPAWGCSSCWFSGIIVKEPEKISPIEISRQLKLLGIESRTFWKPIHLQKPYKRVQRSKTLKDCEDLWGRILTLPCSTGITDEDLKYVVKQVKAVLKKL